MIKCGWMFAGSRLLLPVPINRVTLVPKPGRKEGTRCQRALAAEWDRGAEEIGQQEVAETASGCPQRWCWSKRRTGGTEDSLPCSWDEEGWLPSERERRSRRRSPVGPEPAAIRQVGGGAGNGGLAAGCPRLEEPSPAARRRKGHRAVHQRGPVPSHGTASEPLSWLRTERQCVRETGPRFLFFFPLSPSLFSVTPHPSVSFLSPRLSLPPRYAAAALTGSPRERGEGGSRAQSREYPPACEGRWGYVTSGAGPRAVGTERGRWSEW